VKPTQRKSNIWRKGLPTAKDGTMHIWLIVDGVRRKVSTPEAHADHAKVDGSCPRCGIEDFRVAGGNRRPSEDDRAWEADGVCLACGQNVGLIRADTDTLFGVREDEAVLNGRFRVY